MPKAGILILKTRIPLGLGDRVAISLLLTAVTLPVVVAVAHAWVI